MFLLTSFPDLERKEITASSQQGGWDVSLEILLSPRVWTARNRRLRGLDCREPQLLRFLEGGNFLDRPGCGSHRFVAALGH